jgi:membrane associated rhomboid family serine protease
MAGEAVTMPGPDNQIQVQMGFPSPSRLFTPGVIILLVLMLVGFILRTFAGDFTDSVLALNPPQVLRGHIWQLASYSLINDAMGLVFNGIIVLFIGSMIDREWRTRSFLVLWLVVVVLTGILWIAISVLFKQGMTGMGSQSGVYGLIAAMGLLQRRRPVLGPLQAQHMALLLIGIGMILSISRPLNFIWIAGAGISWAYIQLLWRRGYRVTQTGPAPVGKRGEGFIDLD